ncbi:NAD(P)-binding domain-containing protein [Streptomonospora sp. S1-112]|uniref:NAD(P)-binding domain-containing protein n=1 Tax=Streptomonospora mangrovi TaxID=2883123 RepID=A0A9X3SFW2_9ACTN|nr:NAD(P)-binding domain-containing protein [Streptomonospora mangrovi]MDA0563399.1 NAD(P)-binding domain-containing protein [Streptomonospora mangrovi]
MNAPAPAVTVIGLGPMGHAMAAAYLEHGYAVTVWNRTPARADDLVARGAHRAATPAQALEANPLTVLSLTDYDALDAVLEQAAHADLTGRTLANLTSDTPARARAAAARLAERGAAHITGGVQVPPPLIATPGATAYYSGPPEAVEAHRAALEVLTEVDYLGADPGLAALYYQIGMDMFWTALVGYVHAQAVARANGISAADFLPHARKTLDMGYFLDFYAPRIDAAHHVGDVDRITMGAASMAHVADTAAEAGVDTALPQAVLAAFSRAVEQGRGADSLTRLIDVLGAAD